MANTTKKTSQTNSKTSNQVKKVPNATKKSSSNKSAKKTTIKLPNSFEELKETFLEKCTEKTIHYGYMVFVTYMIILALAYIRAIVWLHPRIITNNILLIMIFTLFPFALWAYSTKFDRWNFHKIKRGWLYASIISGIATLEQPLILFSWNNPVFSVRTIMKWEVTENMTKNMIVTAARVTVLVPFIIITLIVAVPIKNWITSVELKEALDMWRITHSVDLRKNKSSKYDLNILRDLDTGKYISIHEQDRFVHMFINGQSGTGKTSSTIIPAIFNDLNTKIKNMEARQEVLLQMLKDNEAIITGPYANITEANVRPRPKYKKKYEELYDKYPDCGITVMAPNNAMNNTIIQGCEARGIHVNVIDPAKEYDSRYVTKKGIQNFYIPLGLPEEERTIRINDQAKTFSEVMVAANEVDGSGEQYFRDINTSVTTNIAIICMLAANIEGRQTDILEVQRCISDFGELKPLVDVIEDYFDIKVKQLTKDSNNSQNTAEEAYNNNTSRDNSVNNGKDNPYYITIKFVKNELLGSGKDEMFKQARGLRNLMDKFTLDPRYRKILSAPIEQSVNFDEVLKGNEITLVNTALEFGNQTSTGLGLIFLLNFQTAVLRRPEDLRSNHFIWIDEASQYMHKVYDNMYALFRQYRVSTNLAMQSISQMEKNKSTAYLKNIILGAGTQIVFGRVSAEEQKLYQDLAGVVLEELEQKTQQSSASYFSSNASQSESIRRTSQYANKLEGSHIRNRDFQEVSVYKIKDGRVEQGFLAKCQFLDKKELEKRVVKRVNFAKFAPKNVKKGELRLTSEAKSVVDTQKKLFEEAKGKGTIVSSDETKYRRSTPIEQVKDINIPAEEAEKFYESETENKTISDIINNARKESGNTDMTAEPTETEKIAAAGEYMFGNLFEDTTEEDMSTYVDDLGEV